ncbi:MAG: bifunctional 4-hydroxy-2-oxoglutarate aldolase/2-dehydro-3-deoxy-phosphogluconate aldolase [Bacteroidota bacterium]
MKKDEIVERLLNERLIVIIRSSRQADVGQIVDALVAAGVGALEVTSNTPGFTEEIRQAKTKYPNVLVGAGTITRASLAVKALEAGADFFVTPNVVPEVTPIAHQAGIPVVMGALTPTEVAQAVASDSDVVKLFPAEIFGIDYMKALMGPFDKVPFFAVGGIGINEAPNWIAAGAKGIGIGGKLTNLKDGATSITENARKMLGLLAV